MPVIATLLGEINLANSSAQVRIFHYNKVNNLEAYVSVSAKNPASGVKPYGPALFSPSVSGCVQDIGGRFIQSSYEVEESQILKVFTKIKQGYGKMDKIANFFIKVREGAAYRSLKINTLNHHSVLFKTAKIEGCFDLLTLEEALAEGVKVKQEFRRLYAPEAVSTVLTSSDILVQETKTSVKKQIVEVVDPTTGNKTNIVKAKRRRALEL
jgi:hypothetical protein